MKIKLHVSSVCIHAIPETESEKEILKDMVKKGYKPKAYIEALPPQRLGTGYVEEDFGLVIRFE